ncbi:outer membrane beta-barrel protein [Thalassolituus sp. UBA2009]|uniref:outer membrane beta-barrel protein n=1 Tax=Thalassolituus sp. UBA2009 TaxID=1947658 RepID=UPI00257F763D|nr:outer membrane beta-barrel protein [Thalassolituus sp. UBA2009]
MKKSLLTLLLAAATTQVCAEQDVTVQTANAAKQGLGFSLSAGLMAGGDKLAEMDYERGTSDDINAGAGIHLGAGVYYTLGQFRAEARLNWLSDSANGLDEDHDPVKIEFSSYPLDLMLHYQLGKHSLGAGLTHHVNPKLDLDGTEYSFDSPTGSLIEYQYHLNPRFAISAKYQSIEYYYQPADATFDGSGLGVGVSFQL